MRGAGGGYLCRIIPKFCDKIAGAEFAGKIPSQKSGAKVEDARQTFATLSGFDRSAKNPLSEALGF